MSLPAASGRRRRHGLVHKKKAKLDQVRNEINVTPLVDVCLVLLIIFMIISKLLSRGKELPLPETLNHQTEADKNQPIVAVDADGKLYFDKEEMPDLKELKKAVVEAWRATDAKEQRVYVKAAKTTPYGKVYPVIMAIRDLGVTGVDLGTVEKKE